MALQRQRWRLEGSATAAISPDGAEAGMPLEAYLGLAAQMSCHVALMHALPPAQRWLQGDMGAMGAMAAPAAVDPPVESRAWPAWSRLAAAPRASVLTELMWATTARVRSSECPQLVAPHSVALMGPSPLFLAALALPLMAPHSAALTGPAPFFPAAPALLDRLSLMTPVSWEPMALVAWKVLAQETLAPLAHLSALARPVRT